MLTSDLYCAVKGVYLIGLQLSTEAGAGAAAAAAAIEVESLNLQTPLCILKVAGRGTVAIASMQPGRVYSVVSAEKLSKNAFISEDFWLRDLSAHADLFGFTSATDVKPIVETPFESVAAAFKFVMEHENVNKEVKKMFTPTPLAEIGRASTQTVTVCARVLGNSVRAAELTRATCRCCKRENSHVYADGNRRGYVRR